MAELTTEQKLLLEAQRQTLDEQIEQAKDSPVVKKALENNRREILQVLEGKADATLVTKVLSNLQQEVREGMVHLTSPGIRGGKVLTPEEQRALNERVERDWQDRNFRGGR